jgi:hypothetical protein
MALIVENGTGLADAESYLSVNQASAYHRLRGNAAWEDLDFEVQEQALRQATAYIDSLQRYKASRLKPSQALEFPRTGLFDWSGYEVTGVPKRVKDACAELALRAASTSLFTDLARGGKVVSESVGPISTTYADDAPTGTVYTVAVELLKPFARSEAGRMGGPGWTPPAVAAAVSLGVHDTPGEV